MLGDDRQQDHVVTQRVAVLDLGTQRERGGRLVGSEEHGRAGDAVQRRLHGVQLVDVGLQRSLLAGSADRQQREAAMPGAHHRERGRRDEQRQPTAAGHLREVGGEEGEVDREQRCGERSDDGSRPAEDGAGHHEEQHGRDREGPSDRETVGRGEPSRGAEREDDGDHARHEHRVDGREEDLADLALGGVHDRQLRQESEPDRLTGQREDAGDHGLGGDHRRRGREQHHRYPPPGRKQQVERIAGTLRDAEDHRALAEIVRRPGQAKPARTMPPLIGDRPKCPMSA